MCATYYGEADREATAVALVQCAFPETYNREVTGEATVVWQPMQRWPKVMLFTQRGTARRGAPRPTERQDRRANIKFRKSVEDAPSAAVDICTNSGSMQSYFHRKAAKFSDRNGHAASEWQLRIVGLFPIPLLSENLSVAIRNALSVVLTAAVQADPSLTIYEMGIRLLA